MLLIRVVLILLSLTVVGKAHAVQCDYNVTNQWGSGFQGEIQIINTGSSPITNWTVIWGFADSTVVTNVWNATGAGGNPSTAAAPGWATTIAPGNSWTIGFNANGLGSGVSLSGICDSTSPALSASLRLAKRWVDGNNGDAISASTSGLGNNAVISSTSTGSNTDIGASVKIAIDQPVTLPFESFSAGNASSYTTSDWVCDDTANSLVAEGDELTLTNADAGNTVTCTLTNELNNPAAAGDLQCNHTFTNHWGSGFIGQIQITNTGSSPIDNWTASWRYNDGTSVSSVWDAIGSGSNPVTATPPGWFTTLAPGASWNFGFAANGSGSLDSLICDTVSVGTASLTLHKVVINDNGGDAVENDWVLEANQDDGAAELSGVSGASATVAAGNYVLTESGPSGYRLSDLSCDTGTLTGNTLAIAGGETVNCTFTNDDQAAALTLRKIVNNTIGTATADQWTLSASNTTGVSILDGISGSSDVTSNTLSAGTYTLSEADGPSGYLLEKLDCTAGVLDQSNYTLTLANGDLALCTFTNRDVLVDLDIVKTVDNLAPSVGDVITFTLRVQNLGRDPASNVTVTDVLNAGFSLVPGSMTGGSTQILSGANLQWLIDYLDTGAANAVTLEFQSTVVD